MATSNKNSKTSKRGSVSYKTARNPKTGKVILNPKTGKPMKEQVIYD